MLPSVYPDRVCIRGHHPHLVKRDIQLLCDDLGKSGARAGEIHRAHGEIDRAITDEGDLTMRLSGAQGPIA